MVIGSRGAHARQPPPSLTLLQDRFSRQQRSRMAVGTESKQGHVEGWTGRIECSSASQWLFLRVRKAASRLHLPVTLLIAEVPAKRKAELGFRF